MLSPTVAPSEKLNETEVSPVPQVAVAQDPSKILKNQDPQENPTETVRKGRMGGYCKIHNLFFPPSCSAFNMTHSTGARYSGGAP